MLINSTMVGNATNTTIQPILPKVPVAQEKEEGCSITGLYYLVFLYKSFDY